MDISGKWLTSISSPMGPIEMVFDLTQNGDTVEGTCTARGDVLPLYDGVVEGNTAKFKIDITQPMKLTFSANVAIDGDTMTGKAKPGALPAAKLTGVRQR